MKNLVYILLLLCVHANAATWYISAAGSGNNSGSDASNYKPFASFPSVGAGDIVYLKRGDVYNGTIPGYSGAAGNPLTMSATGTGANPIINGFTTLGSWTLSSGNIYSAPISFAELQGVTLDGNYQKRGRYPNTGYLTYTSSTSTSITGTTIGALPNTYVGGEVVMKKLRWILDRNTITAQSGNTITFSTNNSYGGNSATPVDGRGYFIQNALSTLDQEGEWYYDNSASRLYMHFGTGTPTGRVVKAATTAQLLTQGGGYVNYNNIDFEGGNYAFVFQGGANNLTINNCNLRQQAGMGLFANTVNNITISGGSVSNINNNGLYFEYACNNVTIDGVNVSNCGLIPGAGQSGDASYEGIFINGNGTIVRNSTVTNSGYHGIAFVGDNVLIEKNKVDNFNSVKDDGGGIYTVITAGGVTATNRVIDRNIVLNGIGSAAGTGGTSSEASGIYLDDYSNNTTVSNNIIATGTFNGIMLNGGHTNTITNNTVYDYPNQLGFFVYQSNGSRYVRNMTVTGNKFISRTSSQNTMFINQQENEAATLWGTINNNYYARPISEGSSIAWYKWNYSGAPNSTTNYTVSGWKTASGQDASSLPSQVTTTVAADIRFDYNYNASINNLPLGGTYKDVANNTYNNTIALPAYGGSVLIYNSASVTPPPPASNTTIKTHNGKFLMHNGKIITSGTPSLVTPTSVVTNQTIGTLRNDYSDFVGFAFYVGSSPITVTSLGRWITSGNTGSHTLKIVDFATGATVVSTTINTNGMAASAFGYATCTPTVLSANVRYAIVSLEVNGGDFWGGEAPITVTSAINTVRSAYIDGSGLNISSTQDVSYVPVNFKY